MKKLVQYAMALAVVCNITACSEDVSDKDNIVENNEKKLDEKSISKYAKNLNSSFPPFFLMKTFILCLIGILPITGFSQTLNKDSIAFVHSHGQIDESNPLSILYIPSSLCEPSPSS